MDYSALINTLLLLLMNTEAIRLFIFSYQNFYPELKDFSSYALASRKARHLHSLKSFSQTSSGSFDSATWPFAKCLYGKCQNIVRCIHLY